MKPLSMKPLTGKDLEETGHERSPIELSHSHAATFGSLNAHAFSGPRCCPSQELIGKEIGLTQARVCQILHDLRDLGLITWTQVRPTGAKWAHNVYTILVGWKPAGTSRVLALLDRIKGRRPRRIYTKTATTTKERHRKWTSTFTDADAPVFEEIYEDPGGCRRVVLVT